MEYLGVMRSYYLLASITLILVGGYLSYFEFSRLDLISQQNTQNEHANPLQPYLLISATGQQTTNNADNKTNQKLLLQEQQETIDKQAQAIAKLQTQNEQLKQQQEESTKGRITQPQKALIALLIHKNYSDYPSINRIAEVISTELAEIGYTGGISYNTLNGYIKDTEDLTYNKPNNQSKQK